MVFCNIDYEIQEWKLDVIRECKIWERWGAPLPVLSYFRIYACPCLFLYLFLDLFIYSCIYRFVYLLIRDMSLNGFVESGYRADMFSIRFSNGFCRIRISDGYVFTQILKGIPQNPDIGRICFHSGSPQDSAGSGYRTDMRSLRFYKGFRRIRISDG